ncbi:Solute carrier family 22 member 5 [Nymphon striatum]|nr:Solute carrier family 22 member 5 [Nymphon striatum]
MDYRAWSKEDNDVCFVPGCDNSSSKYREQWLTFTTPMVYNEKIESETRSACTMCTPINSTDEDTEKCLISEFDVNSTIKCDKYIFENQHKTLNKEWGLLCDKKYLLNLSMSIYLAGFLCALLSLWVFLSITHHANRMSLMLLTFSTLNIFSKNYYMYVCYRFFIGATSISLGSTLYVILTELCTANSRAIVTGATLGSEFGSFLLVGLAYYFRNWDDLQIAVTIFSTLFLLCFCFLPESPRWLFMKGRNEDAKDTLKKIFRGHKMEHSLEIFDVSANVKIEGNSENKLNILDLIKIPSLRRRFLIIGFIWICDSLISYGITLGAKNMSGSIYINYTLITIGNTIGCIACTLSVKYIRRRLSLCVCFFFLAVLCLTLSLIPEDLVLLAQILTMVATALINAAFNLTYIFTVELFPTPIRSSALGSGSMVSRIGAMAAPFVNSAGYDRHVFNQSLPKILPIDGSDSSDIQNISLNISPIMIDLPVSGAVHVLEDGTRQVVVASRLGVSQSVVSCL